MCYSQRPPYPQLWVASTSWTVWTTSPLPPCSVSGGVTERWTLGLAELIYLHLLCFSPMPASPQNICFMFYIAALIGSNAECSVTGSFFGYHSQAATLFFIPNWTTLPGQIWKHNQSNCWDSACVLRESPHAILTSASSLSSGTERRRGILTFLNWETMMICDYISPPAEWTNLILKIRLEISNQENQVIKSEQRWTYASLSNFCRGQIFQMLTTLSPDRIKPPYLDVYQI